MSDSGRHAGTPTERVSPVITWPEAGREPVAHEVFGIVPQEAVRRHPSDLWRLIAAALIVALTASAADHVTSFQAKVYEAVAALPGGLRDVFWALFAIGSLGPVLGLAVAIVVARRWRLGLLVLVAGVGALLIGLVLRSVVDAQAARSEAGLDAYGPPAYPALVVGVAGAVVFVAAAYLTRPARHLTVALLGVAAMAAVLLTLGLAVDVIGALALGWGVAAAVRFAVGSPAGTPSEAKVAAALDELGVQAADLRLQPEQVWGEVRFSATAPDGHPLSIIVIGRDASDARALAKLWRSIWYKDSGPRVSLRRLDQLEHRAYLLLVATQAGVPVEQVLATGEAGVDNDAVLVLRTLEGTRLADLPPDRVTDDVLLAAWQAAGRLHAARLTHGMLSAANVMLLDDGDVALVDMTVGSAFGPPERHTADDVELLATTAALVGEPRALAIAERVLGRDGLAALLPELQPAALSAPARHGLRDDKRLMGRLRAQGAELVGVEEPKPAALRRVSWANVLMAAATFLGVYLLIGQFTDVPDLGQILKTADWGWVAIAALLSQCPQLTSAVAMLGSCATPLPLGPTTAVQFANNFTGLVAGTVGTTTLVIRYFQKQGKEVAVAVSSGVLNTTAAFFVQAILVAIALIFTASDFDFSSTGDGGGGSSFLLIAIIVVGVAVGVVVTVPKLRRRVRSVLAPQLAAARANLRQIAGMPVKAVQLFGGNLASQVLYALTLDAALHAYGASLPLLQLILINSFASLIGGFVPVPGGMGVVEAGLIAGLTAAGISQTEAVATTFTARLFTAYLPPIWGWVALNWLRRRELV